MSKKSPDAFRTISEVADWLGVPTHVLRFWESRFAQVKPVKRAGGRRYYRPADMQLLGGIRKLLHDDGMTIRGVQKLLREEGVKYVSALSPSLDEPVLPKATKDNVIDLDKAREIEREEAGEENAAGIAKPTEKAVPEEAVPEEAPEVAPAEEEAGTAKEDAAGETIAATAPPAEAPDKAETPAPAPEGPEEAPAMDTVAAATDTGLAATDTAPPVADAPAEEHTDALSDAQEDAFSGSLFESPEQLDFMSHDAEATPDPEIPDALEAAEAAAVGSEASSAAGEDVFTGDAAQEKAPEEATPAQPSFDLSHIPEDPAEDAPAPETAPPLAQRLRHLRLSGETGQVNPAALKAIQIRLVSLRERFEARSSRH